MTCPACGGSASAAVPAFSCRWMRCRDCGGSTLADAPSADGSATTDAALEPGGLDLELLRSRAASVRRLAPGRRLLDIRARNGDFVLAAQDLGLSPVGHESSPTARDAAAARGATLLDTPLEQLAPEFHAVTLWDVLPFDSDPAARVRAARRLLVPGGVLAVSAPNARSLPARLLRSSDPLLDFATHGYRHRLTRAGILALFDRAGLRSLKVESRGMRPLPDLLLARRPGRPPGRRLQRLLEDLSDPARVAAETLQMGETLVAYARR